MAARVTMQDIADELGLSRNTVSKALNNAPGLADATRERIIQKAREMGYKHFVLAQALMTPDQEGALPISGRKYSGEIALLSSRFLGGSHFASLTIDAFHSQIDRLGFTLGMHRVRPAHIESLLLPTTFKRERVAAIICFEMFDRAYDEMLCDLGLPILFVDGPAPVDGRQLPADQLCMENIMGISRLVKDVVAAGRTRIGFIGNYRHCRSFYERYAALRLALDLEGLPLEDKFVIPHNGLQMIGTCFEERGELPDLFVCANDFVATKALLALRGLGFDVPRDVWLSGFDDSPESRTCIPPLTTVHIHTHIIAHTAVRLLLSRMDEPSLEYRQVHTETELLYRASTPL